MMASRTFVDARPVTVRAGSDLLRGDLALPERPGGLVIFAHGSGSSRFSRRNRMVAEVLEDGGFATLLLDLLTPAEESVDIRTGQYRFDVARLGDRVVAALDWAASDRSTKMMPVAVFGASTGAAAALIAAAERPHLVWAVISRGGRPDLAADALARVVAPTLLIVGGADPVVLELNRQAMDRMQTHAELEVVPGASHLFEEPGALAEVSELALDWCRHYLQTDRRGPLPPVS